MTVLEHLSEALRIDRMEKASSPVSLHIQNALNTFGKAGQDEIRKANAARLNRTATSTAKPTVEKDPRSWNPAASLGKFQGLPTREVIQSNPQAQVASSPASANPQSGNKNVPVAETERGVTAKEGQDSINRFLEKVGFGDLTTATEIPKRPTKVLEAYGIEQIKMYLDLVRVEIPEDANDKEIASLLIQNFNPIKGK